MNYITYRDIGKNGRLGNQLFQASCVIATAKKHNMAAFLPEWEYAKYFKNHFITGNIEPTHYYHEPTFHYSPINFNEAIQTRNSADKVFNFTGYYQSSKYFEDCKRTIRELFTPSEEMLIKCAEWFFHYPVTCSIHVRRGDYVNNPFYAQLGMDYYNKAMDHIKKHTDTTLFMIFSDDIPWCKTMFVGDQFEFVEGNKDIEDLFLMSFCDHNVISNSSFSWWGSWLNNHEGKIIVAPKDWFGPVANLDTKDLYTENMILL